MKMRFIWLGIGLVFAVTLAVVIGQRLSAEAMAVMVGVVAGVAASIPTSLIVVWFATRTVLTVGQRPVAPAAPPAPPAPEPRMVMMPPALMAPGYGQPQPFGQPQYAAMYPNASATMPAGYAPYSPPAPSFAPRQFNVIGGTELGGQEPQPQQEVVWPQ